MSSPAEQGSVSLHDVISSAQREPHNVDALLPPILSSLHLPECLSDLILHRTSRHISCSICNVTHSYSHHDFRACLVHSALLGRAYALTAPTPTPQSRKTENETLHYFARLPVELRLYISELHLTSYNHRKELYTMITGVCTRAALSKSTEYPVLYAACILLLTCGASLSATPPTLLDREKRWYTGTKYESWPAFRSAIIDKLDERSQDRDQYVPNEVKNIVAIVREHIVTEAGDLTSRQVADLCLGDLATADVGCLGLEGVFEWDMGG